MDKNLKKDVKVNKNKKIKKTKTKKPLKIDNFKKLDKSLDNKNIIKSKRTIKPLKKESKKTFNQKNSFIKITLLIFIIILLVSFLLIGFKIDGFFSKIFYKNSTVNVVSYNCLYTQNNSNSKLLVGCDHSSTKGYFCSKSLNLKNQVYILEKSNCESLNTCSDGIKNQNETGIDCGGVCPPCFEPECTNNSECNDNNPCTNDVCSSGKCVNTNKINDTSCGEGMVCQNGVCVEITPEPECTNNSECNDNNPCTNDSCSSGECVNTNKINGSSCGNNMVCQSGTCVEITPEPECTNNSQCNDNNPCTNDVCSSGECVNTNKTNGSSCGEGMVCQSGTCVEITPEPECTNNSQCNDNNPCTNDVCSSGECVNTNKTNGSSCGGVMVCESGTCVPSGDACNFPSQCDDHNPCTINYCNANQCAYEYKVEGAICGSGKICQNNVCVGDCQSDLDCGTDTICNNYFCDLQTNTCSSTPKNEGAFCGDSIHEYLTCSSGSCVFDSINLGLCDGPLVNTGNMAAYTLFASVNDNLLSVGQKLLGFASKYVNDDGELKCAGTNFFYDPDDPINPDLSPAGFPYVVFGDVGTPKVAYGYGEVFNDFIRTTDYVCRVKATYEISSEFPSSNKWYPMGLSKVVQFKDYTTGSTTIDFTNTDNCTYVGN